MKAPKFHLVTNGLAILALFIILAAASPSTASTGNSAGGIPGLILTTDMLTNFSDFSAAYLNPALITGIDQAEFTTGAKRWGIVLNPKYGTVAVPFGLYHTAAFSLMEQGLSMVPKTNQKGEVLRGQYLQAAEYVVQGSYAYKILPYLSLGSNATVIIPQVDQEGELGVTFDLGMRWHPVEDYLLGHVSLGLNLQNLVYKDFGRSFGNEFNKFPFNIHFQAHWFNEYYRPFLERFEISFNAAVMDLITEAENFGDPENTISFDPAKTDSFNTALKSYWNSRVDKFKGISYVYGLHAKWFPFKFFGVRSGLNTDGVVPFGISLNWKNINVLKRVQLDYDFGVSLEDSMTDKYAHMFRLSVRFGPTREEAVSERWYRSLVKEPQNDFNEAMRLYLAKKYWLASFAFGKVLAKWPSFSKVDVATFYMGKSYEYLHMFDVARETYTKGLKKYTTSDLRPKFIFQIQNLDYKTGSNESALKNYGFIMNLYRDSDVSPDADYVAGQIYYSKNDLESAINVLNSIAPTNENFPYAQYTLAMINVRRKNYDAALEHLNAVVTLDSTRTISERTLKEMTFVRLGFLFYEQGDLKNAYGAFKQVPAESRFYDEALLGLAWAMVRGGVDPSYQQAVKFADNLVSARPKSTLVAEAYLVMGYAFTLLKEYGKAVDAYKKTIELCDAKYISREEFKARDTENLTIMRGYNEFQRKALTIALRKPTPVLEQQKNEMTPDWEKFDDEIRGFDIFKIEAEMQFNFKKSAIKLKKDAEYALATTLHLVDSEKKVKIIQETGDKSKAIDSEMKNLENQLKELEEK
ncbi:MAG: hypothetical protein V1913_06765 [Fibrobacterota bacterium]